MKRILFLTEGYMKSSLPNAICLKKIIQYLESIGNEIFVISAESEVFANDTRCYYFCSKQSRTEHAINKLIRYPVANLFKVKSYISASEFVLVNNTIDLIVSVTNPVETAEAIKFIKRKHPDIKCCLYEIDPASNRYKHTKSFFQKWLKLRARHWEKSVYSHFESIIHMKSHKYYYSSEFYSSFVSNSLYWDIPAVSKMNLPFEKNHNTGNRLQLIYAGAFYKDLRNPNGLIQSLIQLSTYLTADIYLYINDIMFKDVEKMIHGLSNIHLSHYIPEQELNQKIIQCDALLSLGNKDSDFLPSKIFSYMSTGKSIIHFSFDKNDVAIEYLKRYPKSLLLNCYNPENGKMIYDFLTSNVANSSIDMDFVYREFYENSVEFSAKGFLKLV